MSEPERAYVRSDPRFIARSKLGRGPDETATIPVRDVRVGDLVDLEGDESLGHHPETPWEYAEVVEIEQESPSCIVLYFDSMAAGYDPGQIMTIKRRES